MPAIPAAVVASILLSPNSAMMSRSSFSTASYRGTRRCMGKGSIQYEKYTRRKRKKTIIADQFGSVHSTQSLSCWTRKSCNWCCLYSVVPTGAPRTVTTTWLVHTEFFFKKISIMHHKRTAAALSLGIICSNWLESRMYGTISRKLL